MKKLLIILFAILCLTTGANAAWTTFATLASGTQPLSLFDQMFGYVAGMGVEQCSASGTNSIVLTTNANQPTTGTYTNYQLFGFIAPNNTTSSVTININALGGLPAYSISGSQLGSGALQQGIYYVFAYNSALNSGGGGFQLVSNNSTGNANTNVPQGIISGLVPSSITGSSTTASLTVSSGQVVDTTGVAYIDYSTGNWSVTNGNAINGYQGGTTLPSSSTIHFFLCDGSGGDALFASIYENTVAGLILPSGCNTYYRRIFSIGTNGSGALIPYTATEIEGGGLLAYYSTQVQDFASTGSTSAARSLYTLSVPGGIKVRWLGRIFLNSSGGYALVTSPDESDTPPAAYNANPGFDMSLAGGLNGTGWYGFVTTNTSGQIGVRTNSTGLGVYGYTRGFVDFRRN